MGVHFGIYVLFVVCLLGLSANAKDFTITAPPGSDITSVSSQPTFDLTLVFLFTKQG